MKIDVSIIARDLKLSPQNVESAIELLDAGNTIPFITRFRKDITGGLQESQLLAIKQGLAQLRALAERKSTILRAIEAQGELTDELKAQINKTASSRRLEDLYLPFKTRKQSRASTARQQGLAPLAEEILSGQPMDVAVRATDFVRVDKGLNTVDDVIKGVGDLLSEHFLDNEPLRAELRKLMRESGKLTSKMIEEPAAVEPAAVEAAAIEPAKVEPAGPETATAAPAAVADVTAIGSAADSAQNAAIAPATPTTTPAATPDDAKPTPAEETCEAASGDSATVKSVSMPADELNPQTADTAVAADGDTASSAVPDSVSPAVVANAGSADAKPASPKKKKKKKKKKAKPDPFSDYRDFEQPLSKLPYYRVLAINRGERAGKLKVKVAVDFEKASEIAFARLIPADHPSADFLRKCAIDTLSRSLLPSVEREVRRELTEAAEKHAVEVFANNLRSLLLQPPIRNRTILAIDPGFKHGCSVAVIDACGNLIDSGQVFVVGNQTRQDESKVHLKDWVARHQVDVIAIGNGTACRQVEKLVSDTIAEGLQEHQVRYVMVNEAGASTYSTSEMGREDLPEVTPAIRSAVSIGRRLQDPLSELVKIAPQNIGVGMYQHDVKAKHLAESLEEVVQVCVNQVGVNLNTASSALLKYVSGLNALTARRLVEYRQANGRFNNREELKRVSGIGDATFIQSAGFLRIFGGENAFDATSIHPESYPLAADVLQRVSAQVEDVFPRWLMQPAREETQLAEQVAATPEAQAAASAPPVAAEPASTATAAVTADTTAQLPADSQTASESVELATTSVDPKEIETEVTPPQAEATAPPPEASPGTAEAGEPSATSVSAAEEQEQLERREFDSRRKELVSKLSELDFDAIASQHQCGKLLVKDIVMTLKRPAWDPRDKARKPIFRRGILKLEDVKPEMQLDAQVVNVVDFGAFVDIGLGESSLVHVSQLSAHYVRDPHRLLAIGDVIKVWVSEVDVPRRRVKLTAIRPGVKAAPRRKPGRGSSAPKPDSGSGPANRSRSERPTGSARRPGKYEGGGGKRTERGPAAARRTARPAKPKVAPPITEKMLRGDEPMRSFSDLAQFVSKKPGNTADSRPKAKSKKPEDSGPPKKSSEE